MLIGVLATCTASRVHIDCGFSARICNPHVSEANALAKESLCEFWAHHLDAPQGARNDRHRYRVRAPIEIDPVRVALNPGERGRFEPNLMRVVSTPAVCRCNQVAALCRRG